MSQKIKCRQCGNIVLKSSAIEMKPRCYACSEQCKLDYEDEHKPKEKPVKQKQEEVKMESPPKPLSAMRQLTDYVQTYAPNTDWRRFGATVKRMCADYDMTLSGIQYTLWYMREYQGVQFIDNGLGLVSFWYERAQKYYNWINKIKQQIGTWEMNDDVDVVIKKEREEDIFK